MKDIIKTIIFRDRGQANDYCKKIADITDSVVTLVNDDFINDRIKEHEEKIVEHQKQLEELLKEKNRLTDKLKKEKDIIVGNIKLEKQEIVIATEAIDRHNKGHLVTFQPEGCNTYYFNDDYIGFMITMGIVIIKKTEGEFCLLVNKSLINKKTKYVKKGVSK